MCSHCNTRQPMFMVWKKNPPMFIKLRAKRFWGRLTVQERGAGLGDIFTQNTLSAIKAVCQVLGLSLCGRGGGAGVRQMGGGEGEWRPPHQPEFSSWGATAAHTHMHADAHTKVSSFLLTLLSEHCSHRHPAHMTSHPCQLTQLISSRSGLSCDT